MTTSNQLEEKYKAMEYSVQLISVWAQKNSCDISFLEKSFLNLYETILHRIIKDIPSHYRSIKDKEIEKTFTDDYIICLEDGEKLKMLKRHLHSKYNMSLEEYKNKWGLPQDYPVVAKNYAITRRMIAKKGRKKVLSS